MEILKKAMEEQELLNIELKKHYNKLLKRIKDGEKYFEVNGYDSNFVGYLKLIKELNVVLRNFPSATDEEIENGFEI